MKIERINFLNEEESLKIFTNQGENYILTPYSKYSRRKIDRFRLIKLIAQEMIECRDKNLENDWVPFDVIRKRKEYNRFRSGQLAKIIYDHWIKYTIKKKYGNDTPFILRREGSLKQINNVDKRFEAANAVFGHQGNDENAVYWLGNEDGSTVIEFVESETKKKISEVPPELKPYLIENVLDDKEKSQNAEFFRPAGPEWIDFRKDFIVEREEVDEIIREFENKNLIVIKGTPASGKSVILKNIGYKLANQGKEVFVIEFKKTLPDKKDIFKLHQGYLLIDDAHMNLEYADEIIKIAQSLSNVKILISTRDIEERFGPTYPLKIADYIKNAIKIKGYDAATEIIQKFNKKRKKIPEEIKKKLTKNNLWILAWELKSYEEFGRIDEYAVCKRIMQYMRRDLKELKITNAEDVFLPLSVFYKYELLLKKEFVEEFAESKDIEKLIELHEINQVEIDGFEYLTMHHSEIAEIFLRAFQKLEGFGGKVKKKIGEDWIEKLFRQYLKQFPQEIYSLFFKLGSLPPQSEFIKNLVEKNMDTIKNFIKTADNAGIVTRNAILFRIILLANMEIGVKLFKKTFEAKRSRDVFNAYFSFFRMSYKDLASEFKRLVKS